MEISLEQARKLIIESLKYASVPGLMQNPSVVEFIEGTTDISFNSLEIDSLAVMELLIAIELETDISLSPQEILELASLNNLAIRLSAQKNRPTVRPPLPTPEMHARSNNKLTDITKLYLRCSRNLSTKNSLNKLHISLENRITPQEVTDIKTGLKNPHKKSGNSIYSWISNRYQLLRHYSKMMRPIYRKKHRVQYSWIKKLDKMLLSYSGKKQHEVFFRKRLAPNIRFYSRNGTRKNKKLIICFTGNSLRLMMPIPLFLQQVDADQNDILLLRDPTKNGYRMGVPGIGENLEAAIDRLPELIPLHSYQNVSSFGTSGGGLPAIITALRLGLDAGMSVGGANHDREGNNQFNNNQPGNVITRNSQASKTKLFLVYGRESDEDKKSALKLANDLNAEVIEITDGDKPVLHNSIINIVEQQKFGEFLNNTILAKR